MNSKILLILLTTLMISTTQADCIYGAKDKVRYSRLDTHTIILSGGLGSDIMLKTFCFIYPSSSITVLKDSFCSHENAVLYIDKEVCDARDVTRLN